MEKDGIMVTSSHKGMAKKLRHAATMEVPGSGSKDESSIIRKDTMNWHRVLVGD